jgi:hypothetical protein
VGSLYRAENLKHAGLAFLGLGLLVGGILGHWLEDTLCRVPPSVVRITFASIAVVVIALDLIYRAAFREAAEREGWRRFFNPFSGGHFVVIPTWVVGVLFLCWTLVQGIREGFCG